MSPAIFLDRDGVLIATQVEESVTRPPLSATEARVLDGVAEALGMLRAAGYRLVVVTNQPDVARGRTTLGAVEAINRMLGSAFSFDAIQVCPHDNGDRCGCRKPAPGMLLDAAELLRIDLARSYMVGDRETDVEAGRRAGCRTVLLSSSCAPNTAADHVAVDLLAAAQLILTRTPPNRMAQ